MIDLIFNLLNLSILFGLLGYIFYKYLLPSINKLFEDHKLKFSNLEMLRKELILNQRNVAQKISEQDKLCENLKVKLSKWKKKTEDWILEKAKEFSKQEELLKKKIKKQSENYKYEKAKEELKPELIKQLKENLSNQFEQKEPAEQYISKILKELK